MRFYVLCIVCFLVWCTTSSGQTTGQELGVIYDIPDGAETIFVDETGYNPAQIDIIYQERRIWRIHPVDATWTMQDLETLKQSLYESDATIIVDQPWALLVQRSDGTDIMIYVVETDQWYIQCTTWPFYHSGVRDILHALCRSLTIR